MTIKTNNTLIVANIVDALIEQRRRWEEGTYAASSAELYALLGSTLDLFLKVRKDAGLSKAVTAHLDTYEIAYNSNTSLALRIVRLVFVGSGRETKIEKRAFTYARVLVVAAEEGVDGDALVQFIIDNNGIDEIRRNGATGKTDAQKADQNRNFAEATLVTQRELMSIALSDELQPKDGAIYSLALLRRNEDGTGSIVFGTNNAKVVGSVLVIAGKELKQKVVQAAEDNVAKHEAEQRAENVQRLMAEMTAAHGRFEQPLHISLPVNELTPA